MYDYLEGILNPKFKVIRKLAPIEMQVAVGLTSSSELDWARLQDMYNRATDNTDNEFKPALPRT